MKHPDIDPGLAEPIRFPFPIGAKVWTARAWTHGCCSGCTCRPELRTSEHTVAGYLISEASTHSGARYSGLRVVDSHTGPSGATSIEEVFRTEAEARAWAEADFAARYGRPFVAAPSAPPPAPPAPKPAAGEPPSLAAIVHRDIERTLARKPRPGLFARLFGGRP